MTAHTFAAFGAALSPVASGSAPAPHAAAAPETESRRSAIEFESVFLSAMLKPIFEDLAENASFGGGSGETMWSGLLAEEYAGELARSGGFGIADAVARELLALQEGGRA